MSDFGWHRVTHHCSLLSLAPITFNANTFSCYGGSYFVTIAVIFIICGRPLNVVGPSMPASSPILISRDHCLLFRVYPLLNCLLPLSSPPPRVLQLSTPTLQSYFFQSYITRAWGMPSSFVHSFLFCTTHRRSGPTGSFFLQQIALNYPTLDLSYNTILSRIKIDGFRLYLCS
jgi:hypothetical protein